VTRTAAGRCCAVAHDAAFCNTAFTRVLSRAKILTRLACQPREHSFKVAGATDRAATERMCFTLLYVNCPKLETLAPTLGSPLMPLPIS
jgi:hypothetical protein